VNSMKITIRRILIAVAPAALMIALAAPRLWG
jgi:hypothetical protein